MRWLGLVVLVGCRFEPNAAISPGDDAPVDSPADARPIDAATCPADYDITFVGSTSHYKLIKSGDKAWDQSDACNSAITHLVSIDDTTELGRVQALLDSHGDIAANAMWIGATQRRDATMPKANWFAFSGQPLIDAWKSGEPGDGFDNNEGNHEEQFVALERSLTGFIDFPGDFQHGALCECDGRPLDSSVATIIDSNRF